GVSRKRYLDGSTVNHNRCEGAAFAVVTRNKVKHEIKVGLPRGVAFLQPFSQQCLLSIKHRDRLYRVEVAPARVATALTSQLAGCARAKRHRRFGPWRFVPEVLDLTPATKHDLKAAISLADVVQPRGKRYVFGKPIP